MRAKADSLRLRTVSSVLKGPPHAFNTDDHVGLITLPRPHRVPCGGRSCQDPRGGLRDKPDRPRDFCAPPNALQRQLAPGSWFLDLLIVFKLVVGLGRLVVGLVVGLGLVHVGLVLVHVGLVLVLPPPSSF